MADKTPVRVVFNSSNVATGMAEFQSGETVPVANGGTGLGAIGSAGQIIKVNAAGNALEFGAEGDISITNLVAPTNADLTLTTSGTGGIILNDISISDNAISTNRTNDDFKINASGTGTVNLENLKVGTGGATVTTIFDEDAMGSDSATSLATQQSIKAYVDAQDAAIASDTLTLTNKTIDANGTGNNISNIDIGNMTATVVVLESEGISSNDNDTTLPTSAAVKDYADTKAVLSGSTNNQITTVTGAHAMQGESNLTFDGSTLAVTGAVTVSGDLTVSGDTTTVSTTNTAISDNILELNTGISQSFNDAGIIIERGSTGNNAAIIWDESADTFVLGTTTATAGDKSGGITIDAGSLKIASLEVDGVTITDNVITSNSSNSDLEINANGSGSVVIGQVTTNSVTGEVIPGKIGGTNFANSVLVGHSTTGSLNNANGNVGVGFTSLDALVTADNNVAVGFGSLSALASGNQNVAVGQDTLTVNNSGSENTALGGRSSRLLANGTGNTTVGYNSGTAMNSADADYNILIGHSAGDNITEGAGNVIIGSVDASAVDGDRTLKIAGYDGSTTTTWISGDSSGNLTTVGDVTLANNKKVIFGDAGESISGDGTDLEIDSSRNITLDADSAINLDGDSNGTVNFKDGGAKYFVVSKSSSSAVLSVDATDGDMIFKGDDNGAVITALTLDMSAAGAATFNAGVTATTGTFSGNVAISGDLTVSGDTATVSTTNTTIADNIIELNTGISQSLNDAGIIIERGSTGNNAAIIWDESADTFVLGTTTATAADKSGGITIDAGSLKIASLEVDGVTITDNTVSANASNSALQLASSGTGDIDLNAGADVNIPANIGLTFGDDGEKIEGDGTDLTISSSGDVIMKLTGEQLILHDGTSNIAQFDLTSNNLTVATLGNDKDMFFKGVTGASQFTALTLDMSAAGAATFNDKIVLGTNKAIEFVDTNESIKSDGSKMIIKSGGTTFNLPTADGTAGQALVTDGSGTLSFDSVATTVSDDGLATVKSNKHLGSTARTLDSINATFIDSAFYFFVLNDIVNETISAEMFAVTNNDTASFLGNRRGIESSGGDNVPTLATDISNGQYRVRVTGTSADCRGSFYKVAMSSSTTDATRGNTVTSSNTDVDSASESVDTFAHATFRGAKYFISVDNDSKTEMEVVEALVVHDGTNAFISQYGHTTSGNNSLVTLTAAISGDNVVVSAAGLETNLNLTMHKILLKDNMTAQSNANQKAFAAVTVSSSATAIDLMDIDEANGAVHFIVGANASEGAYSIQEVYTAATPGVPAVTNGPFVSTKGTSQLDFTAAFDTSSENSLELFASSTSGGSTTVSGYRISVLAG